MFHNEKVTGYINLDFVQQINIGEDGGMSLIYNGINCPVEDDIDKRVVIEYLANYSENQHVLERDLQLTGTQLLHCIRKNWDGQ